MFAKILQHFRRKEVDGNLFFIHRGIDSLSNGFMVVHYDNVFHGDLFPDLYQALRE